MQLVSMFSSGVPFHYQNAIQSGLPSATAAKRAAIEEHVKHVHRTAETAAATRAAILDRRLAALIVDLPFLGVGQHLVRLRDLLEAFALGRILVRMVFERQLAVRLLQVFGRRAGIHAEPIVVTGVMDHCAACVWWWSVVVVGVPCLFSATCFIRKYGIFIYTYKYL